MSYLSSITTASQIDNPSHVHVPEYAQGSSSSLSFLFSWQMSILWCYHLGVYQYL